MIRRLVGKVFDDAEVADQIARLPISFNAYGIDRFGVSRLALQRWYSAMAPIYRDYLKVSVFGAEHLPAHSRGMVIGNHSGGIGADASMLSMALLMNNPPRLAHAMAEYFFNTKPYMGMMLNRVGHLTGLPQHARLLLEDERLVVVFPEGARGALKPYSKRYQLQRFGTGFMRLALINRAPIIPFAFIGAEEAFPILTRLDAPSRLLGMPPMPIAPQLVFWPLPVSCQIHFGPPMFFDGDGDEDEDEIHANVDRVRAAIEALIQQGLAMRPKPFMMDRV
ncbi:phospholipid/glycerol acyltransferase [Enhygromyxa salina]|uniref:Phospholipid/glycerol acyltransferase n=1 Tax=Enhygromyxa salina TaxID=215803 RepID=A0A0C1ZSH9_9BACT|nr:lysophospholipid acyltransferase family protein [Enhygromyxa salina]KIG14028.1 phospholipid/glycerol acyltransferase [Enhygromyxa salina]